MSVCDVILSETDVVQPDLFIVLHGGLARITDKNVQGLPDLVIEILSPGTSARDRDLKRKRYEHFRVREYWLVDPDANSIEILGLMPTVLSVSISSHRLLLACPRCFPTSRSI